MLFFADLQTNFHKLRILLEILIGSPPHTPADAKCNQQNQRKQKTPSALYDEYANGNFLFHDKTSALFPNQRTAIWLMNG